MCVYIYICIHIHTHTYIYKPSTLNPGRQECNGWDYCGHTPLFLAAQSGHPAAVRVRSALSSKHMCTPNTTHQTPTPVQGYLAYEKTSTPLGPH